MLKFDHFNHLNSAKYQVEYTFVKLTINKA